MTYNSKFAIGDTVWMVRSERFNRIVKCLPCKNTGKIKIGEEGFICPKCGGRSAHTQYVGEKHYVYDSSEIGQVSIVDSEYSHRDNPNPHVTYMIRATGIGSGQIWKESELFPSEAEAQASCDRANGLLPQDEAVMLDAPVDRFGKVVSVE
jgi:hypothetical protein